MKKGLSILLVFFVFYGWTQNKVILQVDPIEVEEGVPFSISIQSEVPGMVEIDNLPGSFQELSTSQSKKFELDANTGQMLRQFEFNQRGVIAKKGTYTIGPAWIKNGNKTYKSNTITISVKEKTVFYNSTVTAKQLQDPAFGVIQLNKTEIYEGEAVFASAKVYSKFEVTSLPQYAPYEVEKVLKTYPVGSNANSYWVAEAFQGRDYISTVVDKKVVFPSGTGETKVEPFMIVLSQGFNSFKVISNPAIIKVKPLPLNPPKDFIGAVGKLKVNRKLATKKVKQGDAISMEIIIEGTGNLQNSLVPNLNLPKGFSIYGDPTKKEDFRFSSRGANGKIVYEYNLQVNKQGKVILPPTTISYFDVEQEKYVKISTLSDTLRVQPTKKAVLPNPPMTNQITDASPRPPEKNTSQKTAKPFYTNLIFLTSVGTLIATAFLFLMFTKSRKKQPVKEFVVETPKQKTKEEAIGEAENLLDVEGKEFYSKIEEALKIGMKEKMNWTKEGKLNQKEVFDYLNSTNSKETKEKVKLIWEECAMAQYGFESSHKSREELLEMLKSVLR